MGLPSSWMLPETRCAFPLLLMRLASTLSSDVLPAPEGPIIAQVSPPPSEPDTPLRICFSFSLVPTPYWTSAQVNVEVKGATLTRCTSLVRSCCSSLVMVWRGGGTWCGVTPQGAALAWQPPITIR